MRIEPGDEHEAVAERLYRLIDELAGLGARIALLARQLRLPLQTRAEVGQALAGDGRGPVSGRSAARGREACMREELRGLLVLRYELVTRIAGEVGAQAARDILFGAQARLLREGFGPQAPGMDLHPLFEGL